MITLVIALFGEPLEKEIELKNVVWFNVFYDGTIFVDTDKQKDVINGKTYDGKKIMSIRVLNAGDLK